MLDAVSSAPSGVQIGEGRGRKGEVRGVMGEGKDIMRQRWVDWAWEGVRLAV